MFVFKYIYLYNPLTFIVLIRTDLLLTDNVEDSQILCAQVIIDQSCFAMFS